MNYNNFYNAWNRFLKLDSKNTEILAEIQKKNSVSGKQSDELAKSRLTKNDLSMPGFKSLIKLGYIPVVRASKSESAFYTFSAQLGSTGAQGKVYDVVKNGKRYAAKISILEDELPEENDLINHEWIIRKEIHQIHSTLPRNVSKHVVDSLNFEESERRTVGVRHPRIIDSKVCIYIMEQLVPLGEQEVNLLFKGFSAAGSTRGSNPVNNILNPTVLYNFISNIITDNKDLNQSLTSDYNSVAKWLKYSPDMLQTLSPEVFINSVHAALKSSIQSIVNKTLEVVHKNSMRDVKDDDHHISRASDKIIQVIIKNIYSELAIHAADILVQHIFESEKVRVDFFDFKKKIRTQFYDLLFSSISSNLGGALRPGTIVSKLHSDLRNLLFASPEHKFQKSHDDADFKDPSNPMGSDRVMSKQVREFTNAMKYLAANFGIRWYDLHSNNVMKRPSTGDFVATDIGLFNSATTEEYYDNKDPNLESPNN